MNKKHAAKGIDFADSEFESLQMFDRENLLKNYLTLWDERELTLVFSNPIQYFIDWEMLYPNSMKY